MNPLISILFGEEPWSRAIVYRIEEVADFKINIKKKIFKSNNNARFRDDKILIGVDYCCDHFYADEFKSFLNTIRSKKNVGYCFYVKNKIQANQITREIQSLSLGVAEIYGIDPDYFYSIVPISSKKNRQNIEKYIFNQKVDSTFTQKCKQMLKLALIFFGLSDALYDKFVVVVSVGSAGDASKRIR